MREVHVVYDESGRILAVADAEDVTGPGGVVLSHRPVERAGQRSTRLALGDEHRAVGPLGLVRDFEIDPASSPPTLRRRAR